MPAKFRKLENSHETRLRTGTPPNQIWCLEEPRRRFCFSSWDCQLDPFVASADDDPMHWSISRIKSPRSKHRTAVAVANAVFHVTGKRIPKLPFRRNSFDVSHPRPSAQKIERAPAGAL